MRGSLAMLPRVRESAVRATLAAGLAAGLALSLGVGIATSDLVMLAPSVAVAGLSLVLFATRRPYPAWLALAFSAVFCPSLMVTKTLSASAFDLFMPPMLAAMALGGRLLLGRDDWIRGLHTGADGAARGLARASTVYVVILAASLVPAIAAGHGVAASIGAMELTRAIQGLLVFPIGIWLLDSRRRLDGTLDAMMLAGIAFAGVNLIALSMGVTQRAGQTWFLNDPRGPLGGPNEAGNTMIVLVAITSAVWSVRRQKRQLALIGLCLALLVASESRAALLGMIIFAVSAARPSRWRAMLAAAILVALAVPFLPDEYLRRITNTLLLKRGSFDAFSALVRFVSWESSWGVFLAHPWIGAGYRVLPVISSHYNDLRLIVHTAENYYLEIAAGAGIAGLAALGILLARVVGLGRAIRRASEPGTLAHALARRHVPLMLALLATNFTGDYLVGMIGVAQIAVWCALLLRAHSLDQGWPTS